MSRRKEPGPAVRRAYVAGETLETIARRHGISHPLIYRAVDAEGDAPLRRKRLWTPEEDALIMRGTLRGRELAAVLDRTQDAIRSRRLYLRSREDAP